MSSDPLAAPTSLDSLLRTIAALETAQFPNEVWHAAAIARSIDAKLFALCAGQATHAKSDATFEAFAAHADVIRIDEKRVRLRDTARERIVRLLADDRPAAEAASWQIF